MPTLGTGAFTYETTGQDWGDLPADWTLKEATAVAVDAQDRVFVFNRGTHPMLVFDEHGKLIDHWGDGLFSNPHGVSVGPDGTLWCVDNVDHTVQQFTPEGKQLLTLRAEHPAQAMSGDPFCLPAHLAVDPRDGCLYVADGYGNARVHKYSPDGRLLFSWGESGTDPGCFNIVHNIAIDAEGWVYIADRENHRVQVFDTNGRYQTQWVNLSKAACVCLDPSGAPLVYVGEYFAGIASNKTGTNLGPRVTVLNTQGEIQARLSDQSYGDEPGRFYSPHGIAVDSKGHIYVADVSWSEYGQFMDPPRQVRSLQKLVKQG